MIPDDLDHDAWRSDKCAWYAQQLELLSINLQELVKAGAVIPEMQKNDLKLTIERLREIAE